MSFLAPWLREQKSQFISDKNVILLIILIFFMRKVAALLDFATFFINI